MNKNEARTILAEHLALYRTRSYAELAASTEAQKTETLEVRGPTGIPYQIEFNFFWDNKPKGDVRVCGSIDDGGWRAYVPLASSFIISASGNFVGE